MKTAKKVLLSTLITGVCISCCNVIEASESMQDFELDPIFITATRYERKDLSIPASTEVFTREKLDEINARSVMDVLANVPGFVISESPSGNGNPGLRGISGHLSIMINGIPVAKDYYFQMGTLSTAGIERIEVIKGGSAVQYGSNATTGVVNIITKKGAVNSAKVSFGDHKQKGIGGYFGDEKFSGSYNYFSAKDEGTVYLSFKSKYERDFLTRKAYMFNYNPDEHWDIMAIYNEKDNNLDAFSPKTNKYKYSWHNKTHYTMLQSTYSNDDLRVIAYYQNRDWYNHFSKRPEGSHQRGMNYGLQFNNKWKLGKTDLMVGAEYDKENPKQGGMKKHRDHGSVYFMTENKLSDKTDLFVGAREVFTGDSGNEFCPQVQILQKIGNDDIIYTNVNKSLMEAPISKRFGFSPTFIPNPDLQPEKAWTYEVGWKKKISEHGLLKWDIYHMNIKDRFYKIELSDGKSSCKNALEYKNTGTELNYEWYAPKGFSYSVGVSYSNPKQIKEEGSSWERTENRLAFHADLSYRMGKTTASLFANYAGERYNNNGHMMDIDFNIQQRVTDEEKVSLKVANILNREDFKATGGSLVPERNWLITYERDFS